MNWIAKLAAKAPVPIFIARGPDAPDETDRLHLNPALTIVDTPRAASILLVAGTLPHALKMYLHRLHDQLPHPRATVFWHSSPTEPFSNAVEIAHGDDLAWCIQQPFDLHISQWPVPRKVDLSSDKGIDHGVIVGIKDPIQVYSLSPK